MDKRCKYHATKHFGGQMKKFRYLVAGSTLALSFAFMLQGDGAKVSGLITGKAAFSDAKDIKVGSFRKIAVADLPNPHETPSGRNMKQAMPPAGAIPQVAEGFKVEAYVKEGIRAPRQIRRAPNGDLFFAEEQAGNL